MQLDEIERVAVLGAGSMGHGIAEVVAIAGYEVTIRDIDESVIEEGYEQIEWSLGKLEEKAQLQETPEVILDRISTTLDLEEAVATADLVIEAVPEQLELKQNTLADVDAVAPDHAILATNTSSLSITDIASVTEHPEQVIGLHFFNPPVRMDLVEVVHGSQTSEETVETATAFVEAIGKLPIQVRKDVHGFVVNSVLVPFMEEAAWMVDEGDVTHQQIDAAMVYHRGYPMGPFELNDFGGIDVAYHFFDEADKDVPPPIAEKVESGDLGRKTDRGFYDYTAGGASYEPDEATGVDTMRIEARMINEAAKLVGNEVATPEAIDLGLRFGGRFPEGICRRADTIGLDVALETLEQLHEATGKARYETATYLRERVAEGATGEAAGEGFYDYSDGGPFHYIQYKLDDGGVLRITLDRKERLNAFSPDMFDELNRVFDAVDIDSVSCVVLEGAGDQAFSAGADITAFTTESPQAFMDSDEVFDRIYEYDRPTIAKIDGFCLGAGFELLLCCDIRIASHGSRLGSPEIDLGLVPGGGGTQRLPRLVGDVRAKEMILRGKQINASRALDWGLINRAVDSDELDETVEDFVEDFVEGPPVALKVGKHLINDSFDASLEAGLTMESRSFALLTSTEDMLEGVTAFRQNREPEFSGR